MQFISIKSHNAFAQQDITSTIAVMPDGFMEKEFACSFCDTNNDYFDEELPRKILDYLLASPVVIFAKNDTYRGLPYSPHVLNYNQCYETFVLEFERLHRQVIKCGGVVVWFNIHFFNYHKITYRTVSMGQQYGNAFRNLLIDNILDEI